MIAARHAPVMDGRWSYRWTVQSLFKALLCSLKGHDWERRSGRYTVGLIDYDRFYDVENCRRCGLTLGRLCHPPLPGQHPAHNEHNVSSPPYDHLRRLLQRRLRALPTAIP